MLRQAQHAEAAGLILRLSKDVFDYTVLGFFHFQRVDKGGLRNLHLAELTHAFLAGFLFFQQLTFTGYVTAVTLCRNIFAHCADRLPGDDLAADRRCADVGVALLE